MPVKLPDEYINLFGADILAGRFIGELTIAEATALINKSISNARELYWDAVLLFENGRFPRCLSLSILALEEMGKVAQILELLRATDETRKTYWQSFYSHTSKNFTWLLPMLNELRNETSMDKYKAVTDPKGDLCKLPDVLKMRGFYVNMLDNRRYFEPNEAITDVMASYFLKAALINVCEDNIWTTEETLKVWVKHEGGRLSGQIALYNELVELKLISKRRANRIFNNIKKMEKVSSKKSEL